jgi:uncharacterized SAM-binding protein YcdF (DUF218 family)
VALADELRDLARKRAGRLILSASVGLAAYCVAAIGFWQLMLKAHTADLSAFGCGNGSQSAIAIFYTDDPADRAQRIEVGLESIQACPNSRVFLLGGARPSRNYFGSEDMAQLLRRSGVGAERLRTERRSHDTRSNVAELVRLAKSDGASAIVLVSDPFHLPRIRHEIARVKADFSLIDSTAGSNASWAHIIWRSVYELLAWASLVLPESTRQYLLSTAGRT